MDDVLTEEVSIDELKVSKIMYTINIGISSQLKHVLICITDVCAQIVNHLTTSFIVFDDNVKLMFPIHIS